jgi:hypothetical protein
MITISDSKPKATLQAIALSLPMEGCQTMMMGEIFQSSLTITAPPEAWPQAIAYGGCTQTVMIMGLQSSQPSKGA